MVLVLHIQLHSVVMPTFPSPTTLSSGISRYHFAFFNPIDFFVWPRVSERNVDLYNRLPLSFFVLQLIHRSHLLVFWTCQCLPVTPIFFTLSRVKTVDLVYLRSATLILTRLTRGKAHVTTFKIKRSSQYSSALYHHIETTVMNNQQMYLR